MNSFKGQLLTLLAILVSTLVFGQSDTTYASNASNKTEVLQLHSLGKKAELRFEGQRQLDHFNEQILLNGPLSTISFSPLLSHHRAFPEHTQKKNYLLDGQIFAPVPVGHGFRIGRNWCRPVDATIHLEPFFWVRILANDTINQNDNSAPVRTPSYFPGGSIYWRFNANRGKGPDNFAFIPNDTLLNSGVNERRIFYVKTRAFHHSNGQNRTVFIDSTGVINSDPNHPGFINRYDGDFGINLHWELGVGIIFPTITKGKINYLGPDGNPYGISSPRTSHTFSVYTSYYQPIWRLSGSRILQGDFYPAERIRFNVSYHFMSHRDAWLEFAGIRKRRNWKAKKRYHTEPLNERIRINLENDLLLGKWQRGSVFEPEIVPGLSKRRLNTTLTAHFRIPTSNAASLFVQCGWYGSDPYNIYFQRSVIVARAGLSFGVLRYSRGTPFINEQ